MLRYGLGRLLHHARQVLLGALDREFDLRLGFIPAGTGDGTDFVARISRRTQWAHTLAQGTQADEPQLRPEQARTSDQSCRGER